MNARKRRRQGKRSDAKKGIVKTVTLRDFRAFLT